jgi:anti-sigma B factor antagonist
MSTLTIAAQTEATATVVVHPAGEIDADNAHELRDMVSCLLVTRELSLIKVDLAGITFIDSVGIGALVSCYHTAAASGVRLIVCNPTTYVHRLLYVSGLLGLFGSPARPPAQRDPEPV